MSFPHEEPSPSFPSILIAERQQEQHPSHHKSLLLSALTASLKTQSPTHNWIYQSSSECGVQGTSWPKKHCAPTTDMENPAGCQARWLLCGFWPLLYPGLPRIHMHADPESLWGPEGLGKHLRFGSLLRLLTPKHPPSLHTYKTDNLKP